jgi:hypothetical protein
MEPVAPALAEHSEGGPWPRSLPAQEIVGAAVLAGRWRSAAPTRGALVNDRWGEILSRMIRRTAQ